MLKNYFKTALRSLLKNKSFTLINIIGLAIGISAAIVIYLVVQYDFSFEKFQPDGNRIYRIVSDISFQGEVSHNSGVPVPLNKVINGITGVQAAAPFHVYSEGDARVSIPTIHNTPTVFKNADNILVCDQKYFSFIPYHWMAGTAVTALQQPNSVVLTASRAKMYFPGMQPKQTLNKVIVYDDTLRLSVTGIVADLDANTDFKFHDFISYTTFKNEAISSTGGDMDGTSGVGAWGHTSSFDQLFIKVNQQAAVKNIKQQLDALITKNTNRSSKATEAHVFKLQPLSDLHFNTDFDNFDQRVANKSVLYSLLGVAAFLLLLGCINFINLTTAQASQRAKEIGIRKTVGGTRLQLVAQLLTETFLLTLAATLISVFLAIYLIKAFSSFIPAGITYHQLFSWPILLFAVLLMVVITLLAGFYPALILSGYQPVQIIKSQHGMPNVKGNALMLRKSLTVFQFAIALFFIMTTLLVGKQIHYIVNKDLGFKKDAVLYIRTPVNSANTDLKQVYCNKLKAIPQIENLGFGGDAPSSPNSHSTTFRYTNGKTEHENDVELKFADTNYLNVYHIKLLAGRNLQAQDSTSNFIINQTYAKLLGFNKPEQAVGQLVTVDHKREQIIGVVADFYQKSLHQAIKPMVLCYGRSGKNMRTIHIALKPQMAGAESWKAALAQMQNAWQQVFPDNDFEFRFVDESIARFYKAEQNTAQLLNWATVISILISCLGLLGLAIFTTNQRTKEIGIRKVMGAGISQIIALLTTDFVKLIVIGFVIALPFAWYAMNQWLQDYAYHTSISIWIFALAIIIVLLIALLSMSVQTFKAATANPIKSLRSE
ncbi:FtsX-like permease family protein [Mucilaginibacter robiniae]|uniref:FtsX-like permease family protein n=1 Tax=Mucilaginibacter robiniae TaxID=2728022 RepID=A0A7L5DTP6_9SPHI|nr:FtsX-like permease family protein [Mucilaginibacter robiniae]QJD94485.1 FtsX-like permease family protein [Mucilaginibacter robiniae]